MKTDSSDSRHDLSRIIIRHWQLMIEIGIWQIAESKVCKATFQLLTSHRMFPTISMVLNLTLEQDDSSFSILFFRNYNHNLIYFTQYNSVGITSVEAMVEHSY